jgi:hypothetical protein
MADAEKAAAAKANKAAAAKALVEAALAKKAKKGFSPSQKLLIMCVIV